MAKKLLTVSVAAYNVEMYLRQALESFLIPEALDAVEVLVIDDGGKDGSLDIAREFEKKHPGTFRAVHKENGGYGTTVNYSIEHAAGKYFKLLDGDDWFNQNGLRQLLRYLARCDADVVITNYQEVCGNSKKTIDLYAGTGRRKISEVQPKHPVGMWGITYKTEALRRSGLRLPGHCLYTDQLYSTLPFATMEDIEFLNSIVYQYRTDRPEQSCQSSTVVRHLENWLSITRDLISFSVKQTGTPNYPFILFRVAGYHRGVVRVLLYLPTAAERTQKIREWEMYVKQVAPDVWRAAVNNSKMGLLLHLFRMTNYLTCSLPIFS
nr:glycosyltransferase family 2 protein [uncultured Dysosmobacter sp.]